jgi:cysteine desulfuration protein SufE
MADTSLNLPPRLQEIVEDFQLSEGREKLELLLQYAEELPDLPEWVQGQSLDQVEECMTPVFVLAEVKDGNIFYHFDVPKSSPTVRGYASIMKKGLDGLPPEGILKIPGDFYLQMGLDQVLTYQRLNGIAAILAHMKQLAVKEISSGDNLVN